MKAIGFKIGVYVCVGINQEHNIYAIWKGS